VNLLHPFKQINGSNFDLLHEPLNKSIIFHELFELVLEIGACEGSVAGRGGHHVHGDVGEHLRREVRTAQRQSLRTGQLKDGRSERKRRRETGLEVFEMGEGRNVFEGFLGSY
jgi:hypothetical protein